MKKRIVDLAVCAAVCTGLIIACAMVQGCAVFAYQEKTGPEGQLKVKGFMAGPGTVETTGGAKVSVLAIPDASVGLLQK